MSVETPEIPMISPASLRQGVLVESGIDAGDFSPAEVIKTLGSVPEDLSEL